ncbi:MAG: hypothetical protein KKD17_04255 [Nanoarchaeota archaeon]|nr:hypothetical protein [Nanoarchaeota archaeon]
MKLEKIIIASLALAAGCAPARHVQVVQLPEVRQAQQSEPRLVFDEDKNIMTYGGITYDLNADPLKTNIEYFGPTLPETRTNMFITRVPNRGAFRYATERYKGEYRPHTIWLQTPDGFFKMELDREGKIWGEQKLDERPDVLDETKYP